MANSSAQVEVIQDSEEEERPKSKGKRGNDAKAQSEDDAEEQDEEEYEIEAILDAKHGAFPSGRMGYLVKWKGYDEEHNSWVDQEDAENAQDLIDDFWDKRKKQKKSKGPSAKGRPRKSGTKDATSDADEPPPSNKRKKSVTSGRKSKSSQPDPDDDKDDDEGKRQTKKAKKTLRAKSEERMDVDNDDEELEYRPMGKYKEKKSWENLVQRIDTIEKIEGTLKVFFTLNNGDKVVEASQECAKHFPQKLIQFYESNLRWRESE